MAHCNSNFYTSFSSSQIIIKDIWLFNKHSNPCKGYSTEQLHQIDVKTKSRIDNIKEIQKIQELKLLKDGLKC